MTVPAPSREPSLKEPQLSARRRGAEESSGCEPVLSGAMPREEIIAHLVSQLNEQRQSPEARRQLNRTVDCSSCGDRYPAWQSRLLGGKCIDCYLEIAVGRLPDDPTWMLPGFLRAVPARAFRRPGAVEETE